MFGFLEISPQCLTQEQALRYKGCYCGLCRCIGEHYGQTARLTLTYDMAFLIMLLSSLYEPEEEIGENRCVRHPLEAKAWWKNPFTEYAADLNVLLAYYKCYDDWKDDRSAGSFLKMQALKGSFRIAEARLGDKAGEIRECLDELSAVEAENRGADDASAAFGRLMAICFTPKEDLWTGHLYAMGDAIGRVIYLMDAAVDLDKDRKDGSYNPLKDYADLDDREERFREILNIFMGDAVAHFDYLPLVQDADILKNILCSGIWTQFNRKYQVDKETEIKD